MQTAVRLLPLFVAGVILNIVITLVLGRLSLVLAIGRCFFFCHCLDFHLSLLSVSGTFLTGVASLFYALDRSSYSYWGLEFTGIVLGVLGSDLVFASGTLFVAAIVHPHEQSLAGALFQTMAGVSILIRL